MFSRDFSDPSEISPELAHLKVHREMSPCRTSQGTLESVKTQTQPETAQKLPQCRGKKPKGEIKFQSKHSEDPEQHRCSFCTMTLTDHHSSSARDSYSQKR